MSGVRIPDPYTRHRIIIERAKVSLSTRTVNRKGYHLIIDDVPAYICEQCNEPLFPEEAVELVQEMIRNLDSRRRELDTVLVPA